MAALERGKLFVPPMAGAGLSFEAWLAKSERTQGESVGNGLGAAAGGCERRKRRGRKKYWKWRSKKQQGECQKLEECLAFEVGF